MKRNQCVCFFVITSQRGFSIFGRISSRSARTTGRNVIPGVFITPAWWRRVCCHGGAIYEYTYSNKI
jgi:hypothetical protein